ncbi:MAG TPA: glycine cleavage T C-terminal barrel domain-containing protein [Candidatus Polarisedimenticolaceae bacterium]|nr:glycine cleavage T C-terminal barrel domain-containing protein [Candidatus Polarisedimenticolaceae bacterium]
MSAAALEAAQTSCAVADRSDLARLRADGPDFLDLLHRLSTGDVRRLGIGEGAATVLTTAKGRIVDRLLVHRLREDRVLVVGSPGRSASVLAHLTRFTFAERTGLSEVTEATALLALLGPRARDRAAERGLIVPAPLGAVEQVWQGVEVTVLGQDGSSAEGLSLVVERALEAPLREAVAALGPLLDAAGVEAWRILRGFPGPAEMDEERNPLEAGLWDAVSFTKGCYVGQEVVARLRTYDKIARSRVTLALPQGAAVPPRGAALRQGERALGAVTSAVLPPGSLGPVAMGYLRREAAQAGAPVTVTWEGGAAEAVVSTVSPARAA